MAQNVNGFLGTFPGGSNNLALVTGPGSLWSNTSSLFIGQFGGANQLVASNGGAVFAGFNLVLGSEASSTRNRVVVDGGTLRVRKGLFNPGASALDIRRGTNVFNSGLIDADWLVMTNPAGLFEFNGGTLVTRGAVISNGRVFTVGNSTSAATLQLLGGMHGFANNLVIANNASLLGNGTVTGILTVQSGGTLAPGASIGTLLLSNSPVLQGATIMEISKNGAALTNDQIQVAGTLTRGGSLTVTNIGPDTLAAGNRFPLFHAASYAGSFSSLTLPPLAAGLAWTNKLGVDGSIEVVPPPPPTLSFQFSNNLLTVSWPTNAASFCLETAFDLTPPVFWQPVTNAMVISGPLCLLSLPKNPAIAKQYFRLAFPCPVAPVVLALQHSNNVMTVSWPSNAFRLETTFNLAPPVSWQTVSNGISNSGPMRTFAFTNNPAVPNQFFRLQSP